MRLRGFSTLRALLLGLVLSAPLSSFAFLGMNVGATLQGPRPAWTKELGGRGKPVNTMGYAVAVDPSGNIFVAGNTSADLDGNTLMGSNDFFVTKYDSTGAKVWTRQLGVANQYADGYGVATDSSGNVFVAGYTSAGLDGNTLTGVQDLFVTKYNSSGAKQWTQQLGAASATVTARGVTVDASGNVFVAGYTNRGLDGNTLAGTQDLFVTKYDSTGAKIWTRELGTSSVSAFGYGVTTDSSGNIFVTGLTIGGLDGNTAAGTNDFFLTKYDSTGTKAWTKELGVASKATTAYGVSTDSSGNIFVAGSTTGGLDGNTLTGATDFFVTKYDSTGTKQWTHQLGVASQSTYAQAVATDSSGNVFVGGYTTGGLDGNTLAGTMDHFVTKYDSTGAKVWTKQLGVASAPTIGRGVATDSSGNIFIGGYTGGGLDGNTVTAAGGYDFFLTKYSNAGAKAWTKQLGGLGPATVSQGGGVATSANGSVYVAGSTNGGMDGLTQTGTSDFFLIKYDSTGAKIWTRELGVAGGNTGASGVATNSSGDVFVTGTIQSGGLDGNTQMGIRDFFVTKYNSSGTKQWTKQLGVATRNTYSNAIATDSSGNIFIAGYTNGGLDGNTLTGSTDFYVTKYDSTGTKVWTKQMGVPLKSTGAQKVTTDSSGNVFVAGYTNGNLDGNTVTGTYDFFVTKYDSTGAKIWTKLLGVAGASTYGNGVVVDSSGNIFIGGYTSGGLDGNTLAGTQDVFVTKFDSTGTKQWTRQLGVAAAQSISIGVVSDFFGNVFIAGYSGGGLDGNALTGTKDAFVTKYTSQGVRQWTKQLGASSATLNSTGIAIDSSGHLYISGEGDRGIDFNSLTGAADSFVSQYIGN